MSVTKKILMLFLAIMTAISFAACSGSEKSIQTPSGNAYQYKLDDGSMPIIIDGVNLYTASMEEIRSIAKNSGGHLETPEDEFSAATQGAIQLDKVFDNWSPSTLCCVFYNENANVWIVHGLTNKNDLMKRLGMIVFAASDGEIIHMSLQS